MRNLVITAAAIVALAVFQTDAAADQSVIADFDSGPPSNVGGNYGAFAPSAGEQEFVCLESMDDAEKHGDAGASMRLVYNVGKAGAFNGFWMKLGPEEVGNNFDASGFSKLTFWAKGDEQNGIPSKFKIELKSDSGKPGVKYVSGISGKWNKVELPLSEFAGVDLSKLNELVIVFEQKAAAPATKGVLYIDDLAFEK